MTKAKITKNVEFGLVLMLAIDNLLKKNQSKQKDGTKVSIFLKYPVHITKKKRLNNTYTLLCRYLIMTFDRKKH